MFTVFSSIPIPCAVDIVFFTALIIALIAGTVRGASGEIARLLGLVCGAAAAYVSYKVLVAKFSIDPALAFAGALVVAVIVVMLTHHTARKIIRLILGQPADAISGAVMAVVGAFLILAVLWCGITIFIPQKFYDDNFANSFSKKLVHPLVEKIQEIQIGGMN